ncbi:unnamed protein product [Pseudo-nitzschia multistriata]|uniref:Uncharacterized protein n=1 Tax=Pseudo-nitzschia multistriata TaxID=183589 RepID=A0A448ZIJ4_9STRA|nr:unnamed protein product [Pseudo-nitzschia multistriata]
MDDTATEYLAKHGLADIIQKLTSEKPEDPYKFLVDSVSALSLDANAAPDSGAGATDAPAAGVSASETGASEQASGENQQKRSKKKKKDKVAKKKQGPNKGGG